MKKLSIMLAVMGVGLMMAQSAFAVPVLGGQLYSLGGDVEVEVMPASAGYTSELWLFDPAEPDVFIATNRDVGLVVNLGSFTAGAELLFGIYVRNTGDRFYMGPGSRNPDGIMHAAVDFLAPGVANVGFEDLWGGGDRDYDDNVFQFRGSIASKPVPEPGTWLLLGSGLAGLVAFRKKFARN